MSIIPKNNIVKTIDQMEIGESINVNIKEVRVIMDGIPYIYKFAREQKFGIEENLAVITRTKSGYDLKIPEKSEVQMYKSIDETNYIQCSFVGYAKSSDFCS